MEGMKFMRSPRQLRDAGVRRRLLPFFLYGLVLWALAFRPLPVPAAESEAAPLPVPARFVAVFGTAGCRECRELKEWWADASEGATAGVRLVFVNIEKPRNFELLAALEKELGVKAGADDTLPAIYAPPRTLAYNYEKYAPLLPELAESARQARSFSPLLAGLAHAAAADGEVMLSYDVPDGGGPAAAPPADAPVNLLPPRHLAYFFLPRCPHCSRMNLEIAHLEKMMPGLCVSRYDITTPDGLATFLCTGMALGVSCGGDGDSLRAPALVWEDGWHSAAPSRESLAAKVGRWLAGRPGPQTPPLLPDGLAEKLRPSDESPFWECFTEAEKRTALARNRSFLDRLDWGAILAAGLIDGINPCAFATAIFLVGYLLYLGRGKRDVFRLGASFCLGVFATYFLLGLGLSKLADLLGRLEWLKAAVYLAIGAGALLLAGLHLRDAWRFRRSGLARDMHMGLSQATTRKIHGYIRTYVGNRSLLLAGLALGVLVSSLELVCTGQIYLPALMVMNRTGMTGRSLLLLMAYNLAFILPLVLVTVLAAHGVSGKALAEFARRNVVRTKLLMAALFLLLAAAMVWLAQR
jgi:cytochrome c biogenesis protein CcdA